MKKSIIIILIIGFSAILKSQEDSIEPISRAIKKGFSINIGIGLQTENQGIYIEDVKWDKYNYLQFQLGAQWYIKPKDKFGLGIKAVFADFSYTESKSATEQGWYTYNDQISNKHISFSFLSVGPLATIAITPNIGLDAYYILRPTYNLTDSPNGIGKNTGFGITHVLGSALRIGVFNLGCEYVFGEIKSISDNVASLASSSSTINANATGKLNNQQLRIILGVKF